MQKTATPEERKEVKRILAEIEEADKVQPGEITTAALPAVVVYAVWLIVRFGIPWLITYANSVFITVFRNQSIKYLVCKELRNGSNGWGWSWYCNGTYY